MSRSPLGARSDVKIDPLLTEPADRDRPPARRRPPPPGSRRRSGAVALGVAGAAVAAVVGLTQAVGNDRGDATVGSPAGPSTSAVASTARAPSQPASTTT